MEEKGLRVNLGKTKVMKYEARFGPTQNLGKCSCGVCRKGMNNDQVDVWYSLKGMNNDQVDVWYSLKE